MDGFKERGVGRADALAGYQAYDGGAAATWGGGRVAGVHEATHQIAQSVKLHARAHNATYVPGNPTLSVTYNPDGTVDTTTENGVLTTFAYTSDGTVHTQTRAGVTKTFTYDANGNVTGAA